MRSLRRYRRAHHPPARLMTVGCLLLLLPLGTGVGRATVAAEDRSAATMDAGGMFIPDSDPQDLWRESLI